MNAIIFAPGEQQLGSCRPSTLHRRLRGPRLPRWLLNYIPFHISRGRPNPTYLLHTPHTLYLPPSYPFVPFPTVVFPHRLYTLCISSYSSFLSQPSSLPPSTPQPSSLVPPPPSCRINSPSTLDLFHVTEREEQPHCYSFSPLYNSSKTNLWLICMPHSVHNCTAASAQCQLVEIHIFCSRRDYCAIYSPLSLK